MSLDDKLREIILDVSELPEDFITQKDVNRIKQAFEDEGYYKTNDVMIAALMRGTADATKDLRMTGQEWYDRFTKECPFPAGGRSTVVGWLGVQEAAKRAAGIENE